MYKIYLLGLIFLFGKAVPAQQVMNMANTRLNSLGGTKDAGFIYRSGIRNTSKEITNSDKQFRLDARIDETYNPVNGAFEKLYKTVFHYNSSGYADSVLYCEWDSIRNEFVDTEKSVLTFNAGGSLFRRINSVFRSETGEWVPSYKFDYGKDTLSRNGLINQYRFDNGKWELVATIINVFGQYEYPVQSVTYTSSTTDGAWEISIKENYTYNDAGQLIREGTDFRDIELQTWDPFWNIHYQYDESGNLVSQIIDFWNRDSLKCTPGYKTEYTYDPEQSFANIMSPSMDWLVNSFIGDFVYQPIFTINYGFKNNQWMIDGRSTFVYSGLTSSKDFRELSAGIKVYPNPGSGIICIDLNNPAMSGEIRIFDLAGKQLLVEKFTGNIDLSLQYLQAKTLIYTVQTPKDLFSGKIMLAR